MNININRPQRWGERRGKSDFSDTDNVLLQITLAFAIILGYLLSDGLATQVTLAGRAKKSEAALGKILHTPLGQGAMQQAKNEIEIQRLKLLNAWGEVRSERPVRHRLTELSDVETIKLCEDDGRLPDDDRYRELLLLATPVFPTTDPREIVSRPEVHRLLQKSWNQVEDFVKDGQTKAVSAAVEGAFSLLPPGESGPAEAILFDPSIPCSANLLSVAGAIRRDLQDERKRLALLQLQVVERVALARLATRQVGSAQSDPRRALHDLVSELSEPLGLLPEVEEQLLRDL